MPLFTPLLRIEAKNTYSSVGVFFCVALRKELKSYEKTVKTVFTVALLLSIATSLIFPAYATRDISFSESVERVIIPSVCPYCGADGTVSFQGMVYTDIGDIIYVERRYYCSACKMTFYEYDHTISRI